jgi:hypothetical protein
MTTSSAWEVNFFIIATTTPTSHDDQLYANGLMQIPVVVTVGASYQDQDSQPYELTDSDLERIELYALDDQHHALSGEGSWTVSDARNPLFGNSLEIQVSGKDDAPKETTPARAEVLGAADPALRSKVFWLSTTAVETKSFGARVKQPDNTVVTTRFSPYNASVKITGLAPIVYAMDSVNFSREDTANGTFNYYSQASEDENWHVSGATWDQDNYYVTSKVHPFVAADVSGQDSTGYGEGHPPDWRLSNCYGYYSAGRGTMRLSYIWGLDGRTTTTAGLYKRAAISDAGQVRAADAFVNMTVNQRTNAVCLTRLAFDAPDAIWGEDWSAQDTTFTVYDQYGNKGTFKAGYSDNHNLVAISDV